MIENACKVYARGASRIGTPAARKGRESGMKNSREQIHHQVNDRPAELSVIPSRFTSRDTPFHAIRLSLRPSVREGVADGTDGLTVRQSVVFSRVCARFILDFLSPSPFLDVDVHDKKTARPPPPRLPESI